ncbi:hypothetical protein O6H91_03G017800 [Diphasiastrum complanatum]|uniref:Uncharacterized protein n=1 Tax=Diphasiastrum complanatum TaxID=34168 RepID=A0ACC2E3T5_DIPCM|nr:hypothetical protein O6H91_03G017800 [Diphasiastrum complanatum]
MLGRAVCCQVATCCVAAVCNVTALCAGLFLCSSSIAQLPSTHTICYHHTYQLRWLAFFCIADLRRRECTSGGGALACLSVATWSLVCKAYNNKGIAKIILHKRSKGNTLVTSESTANWFLPPNT